MSESNEDKNPAENRESIFKIMDGIIAQLNKTMKMFIIMILSIMIIPPLSFAVTFALLEPPFGPNEPEPHERFAPRLHPGYVARIVPIIISLVWLGIGIRQWFVLSKWTKKYERYKELQKKIDEKLDSDNDEGKRGQQ